MAFFSGTTVERQRLGNMEEALTLYRMKEALTLYRRAAEKGHVLAQCRLHDLLLDSDQTVEAMKWFRKLAGKRCYRVY